MSHIIISPFSNSDIRDWPVGHYAELVGLLLDRLPDVHIHVIGTQNQKSKACEVVRFHPATRVTNDCGRYPWSAILQLLKTADCVVANNSGIGHLGGYFGVPTVCIFGGSHQRHEWRALGATVVLVSRVIGCSPCQLDHGGASYYDKACLREIKPAKVVDAVLSAARPMKRAGARSGVAGDFPTLPRSALEPIQASPPGRP